MATTLWLAMAALGFGQASVRYNPTTNAVVDGPPALVAIAANSGTLNLGSVTLTLPASFITASGSQTLTNKTISGASNTLSNIGNASLTNSAITIAGTSTSLGGSITASAIADSLGSTRGSVLYRGASGWSALTPGTSGKVLTSAGSGADPAWQTAAGGGGGAQLAWTHIASAGTIGARQFQTNNESSPESTTNIALSGDVIGWAQIGSSTDAAALPIGTGILFLGPSGGCLFETTGTLDGYGTGLLTVSVALRWNFGGNWVNGQSYSVVILPAKQTIAVEDLTGAVLPAFDGSALTNLTAANLVGALPALDGSALTGISISTLSGGSSTFGSLGTGVWGTTDYLSAAQFYGNGGNLTGITVSTVEAASSIAPVADGTYTVGIGGSQNGTITVSHGIITAVQEAMP